MNPESFPPTIQEPSSPEERKKKLQAELQTMPGDPSRGEKLKELIALVQEEEERKGGEIAVPDTAIAKNTNPTEIVVTDASAPVDMIKPEQPFAQVKEEPQQN